MAENAAPPLSTISTGSSPRPRPRLQEGRTPSFLQLARRTSAQERINDILERAESLGSSFTSQHSPRMQPLLGSSPGAAPIPEQDSSADEATGPGLRLPDQAMNYQSTQTTSVPRSRKTTLGRRLSSHQQLPNLGQTTVDAGGGGGVGVSNGSARNPGADKEKNWLRRVLHNFQSVELENKGSVARDHLALERTFLAWLRTSLAFASIGIAVTQLFRLNSTLQSDTSSSSSNATLRRLGKPLGATFLGISILILILGYNRFVQGQRWIMKGKFPASRGTILLVSFVAFALMAASLVVVVVVQPNLAGT